MGDLYFDGAANTPLDPKVYAAMRPYFSSKFFGNASSTHDYGMKASMAVESSRQKMAEVMSVSPSSVIFTSGATEGNNTVIKSMVFAQFAQGHMHPHIICGGTEHSSVLNACKEMEEIGCHVTYIGPTTSGRIRETDIYNAVTTDTILICLMSINNELGTENPVTAVTAFARNHNIKTLVDCTQCVSYGGMYMRLGKIYPFADMMTFSAHKIYGPLGVGCLIVNDGDCLENVLKKFPLLSGGSQEHGARGGTYNVPGIVGMSVAVELMANTPLYDHYAKLYNYMMDRIKKLELPVLTNVVPDHKNIISLDITVLRQSDSAAADLTMLGVACSSGSACDATHDETAGDFNPSHVLSGIDLSEISIRGTIRVSFTKYTTKKDIDNFVGILNNM